MLMKKCYVVIVLISLQLSFIFYTVKATSAKMVLAKNSKAMASIVLPPNPSVVQRFAGDELKKYLDKISHADFKIVSSAATKQPSLYIRKYESGQKEEYKIVCEGKDIILSGSNEGMVLHAVYDFLARLGCRWLAPEFSFYNDAAEYIPYKKELFYEGLSKIVKSPVFAYRKLDVEEGLSHTVENLKQMIDWMPKLGFNTLMVPSDYQGAGRVMWDKWREELTPELKKRGLLIEVGGHGYQNFINPKMENGTLFEKHPDWFGKNVNCEPDIDDKLVFNTANKAAFDYFLGNVRKYVEAHPEIDIFDLWPPDGARWSECPVDSALGTPEDRQAMLINQVDSVIKILRPELKLQVVAYAKAIHPPKNVVLNKNVLVDFCPIDQNFESQIFETSSSTNVNYVKTLLAWRKQFSGDIGLYTYFRKYAWKSLPNVIPNYIQKDIQWYAKVPLEGICTYAEPGDWYTYEINHYLLGKLMWDPDLNVDSVTHLFYKTRYGEQWQVARSTYELLENTVRFYGNIRFSSLKPEKDIALTIEKIQEQIKTVQAAKTVSSGVVSTNLNKLLLMLQYAVKDMEVKKGVSANEPRKLVREQAEHILQWLGKYKDEGTFVVTGREITENFIRSYYRKN